MFFEDFSGVEGRVGFQLVKLFTQTIDESFGTLLTGAVSPEEHPKSRATLDVLGLALSWPNSIGGVHVHHVDWS